MHMHKRVCFNALSARLSAYVSPVTVVTQIMQIGKNYSGHNLLERCDDYQTEYILCVL